ncbi:MAG: hypothetical protein IPN89_13545 [Saprospiraceae bacterium]|jgi:cytochrome c553|nr:hypothetical protein [Saprospiraceae bacterium]
MNMFNRISSVLFCCAFLIVSCSKDETTTNDCTGVTPTYTNDIAAIYNASCATAGCHSGAFPADGLDLSSYAKAKSASLNNSKVLSSMKHASGVKAMPQGAAKLSDDKIKKVECWIKNGAPE